jgi:hypothetical protein
MIQIPRSPAVVFSQTRSAWPVQEVCGAGDAPLSGDSRTRALDEIPLAESHKSTADPKRPPKRQSVERGIRHRGTGRERGK